MPPSKRQKTGAKSSATTQDSPDDGANSPTSHKNDTGGELRDTDNIPLEEYVCIRQFFFDFKKERAASDADFDEHLNEDELHESYSEEMEKMKTYMFQPAAEHKDWKWVTQWQSFTMFSDYLTRSTYCDPDRFDMYISNDWYGWGMQELMENLVGEFDKEWKKGTRKSLQKLWAVTSATALWLNQAEMGALIMNEDGEKTAAVIELIGFAFLTSLSALEKAGELKGDSTFRDLPLVISLYLEWVHDLPAYGIEGDNVAWASEAVRYFKKANLDPSKGVFGTEELLKKCEELTWEEPLDEVPDEEVALRSGEQFWAWNKRIKKYKEEHKPIFGGTKYDITKMKKAERAQYSFDGKDPLANFSVKDLRENRLQIL